MDSKNNSRSYDDLPAYEDRDTRSEWDNRGRNYQSNDYVYQSNDYVPRDELAARQRDRALQEERRGQYNAYNSQYPSQQPLNSTYYTNTRPQEYEEDDSAMGRRDQRSNSRSYQINDYVDRIESMIKRRGLGGSRDMQRGCTCGGECEIHGRRGGDDGGSRRQGGGILQRRMDRRAEKGRGGLLSGLIGDLIAKR